MIEEPGDSVEKVAFLNGVLSACSEEPPPLEENESDKAINELNEQIEQLKMKQAAELNEMLKKLQGLLDQ